MTSWHGNAATGLLWGESTCHWWILLTRGQYCRPSMNSLLLTRTNCWTISQIGSCFRQLGAHVTWCNALATDNPHSSPMMLRYWSAFGEFKDWCFFLPQPHRSQGWFYVRAQPMRDVITKSRCLSLAGHKPRISPGSVYRMVLSCHHCSDVLKYMVLYTKPYEYFTTYSSHINVGKQTATIWVLENIQWLWVL